MYFYTINNSDCKKMWIYLTNSKCIPYDLLKLYSRVYLITRVWFCQWKLTSLFHSTQHWIHTRKKTTQCLWVLWWQQSWQWKKRQWLHKVCPNLWAVLSLFPAAEMMSSSISVSPKWSQVRRGRSHINVRGHSLTLHLTKWVKNDKKKKSEARLIFSHYRIDYSP